jgi:hypothetical protein
MRHSKKINLIVLVISTIAVLILTAVSLLAAFAVDEGTDGGGFAMLMFSKLFYIFRFPTHPLFLDIMENGGWYDFLGLLGVNVLIYGFLIERIISWLK